MPRASANAWLLRQAGTRNSYLMLDMEEYELVERTVVLCRTLLARGIPAAPTLQAALLRSESDLRTLLMAGAPAVRLVKGAFAGRAARAWSSPAEIRQNYLKLASILLAEESRRAGVFPVFATRDAGLIESLRELARQQGWQQGDYEFELLYGVRPDLHARILSAGEQLRLYVPCGPQWWPYVARRIADHPRNSIQVIGALSASTPGGRR